MNEFMKLLVWQMAQILGYEGQTDLAAHSILLLVDFDENRFHPVFIGRALELSGMGPGIPWDEDVRLLLKYVIAEEYKNEMELFFSEQAARRKYSKQRAFDSANYVSLLSNGKKWTHCIQSLFTSADSIGKITEQLKKELPFYNSADIEFPEVTPTARTEGEHLMSYYLVIEVDAIRKSLESLRYLARHDQLTGLYNRHMMAEIVEDAPSVVIIIDIDKFKEINDGYGHTAGDEALCALANRLEVIFWHHNRDMIFRLGGDEFLVVMKGAQVREALDAIRQLCEPMTVTTSENHCVNLTVSAGYARCEDNFKAALKAADEALYTVKANGRNGYAGADGLHANGK